MKRDWELIRKILSAVEDNPAGETLGATEIDAGDHIVVLDHIDLLNDAGFLKAEVVKFIGGGGDAIITGLTFAGHDLLDTIRNDTMWSGIKKTAMSKGLDLTFEVVKQAGKMVLDNVLAGKPIPGIG